MKFNNKKCRTRYLPKYLFNVGLLTQKCSATSVFVTVGSSNIACALRTSALLIFAFRPPFRPRARAAARPTLVRSEIRRRSN